MRVVLRKRDWHRGRAPGFSVFPDLSTRIPDTGRDSSSCVSQANCDFTILEKLLGVLLRAWQAFE